MSKNQKIKMMIGDTGKAGMGALIALMAMGGATAADWKMDAGITARGTYTDNANLSTSGSKSDFVTEITPFISAKKDGARLKVDARYAMQNLYYMEDSSRSTIYHQLNGRANAELVEDFFFFDAQARISQATISPLGATGIDNTTATGNITSVRSVTLSPYIRHRFGSTANFNARYTIADTNNSSGGLSDSSNSTFGMSLASGSDFGRWIWGLNYLDQTVDYADRSDVSFVTTSANLGYLVSSQIRINGTLGNEKNDFQGGSGNRGGSFWNLSGTWNPSNRTSFELGYGHRYYGKTWNMAFKRRGAFSEWTADYAEAVTTANSQFSGLVPINLTFGVVNTQGAQIGTANVTVNDPTQIVSNQVFLSKRFGTGFSWKKGKTGINLSAYHARQRAQESGQISSSLRNGAFQNYNELKQIGLNVGYSYRFNPQISANVGLGLTRSTYSDLGRSDNSNYFTMSLDRKFSPHLTGSVSLRRQTRDSNQSADYTENAITGSVTYNF